MGVGGGWEEVLFITSLGVDVSGITCPVAFPAHCSLGETATQVPCFALALEWAQNYLASNSLFL